MAAPWKSIFAVRLIRKSCSLSAYGNASRFGIHNTAAVKKYRNEIHDAQIPTSEYHRNEINLEERPKFAVDKDSDFSWVDRILPSGLHPPAPEGPTPSGWKPPTAKFGDHPYFIRRTSTHLLPVYLKETHKKLRKTTLVRHIDGDLWALEIELRQFLEEKYQLKMNTEVNEVSRVVKINGIYLEDVSEFLLEKGF